MTAPTHSPANEQILDPVVVPDDTVENQCIDANCTLCAPTAQMSEFPLPPTHRSGRQARKPRKVKTLRIKVEVEIRLPKSSGRSI